MGVRGKVRGALSWGPEYEPVPVPTSPGRHCDGDGRGGESGPPQPWAPPHALDPWEMSKGIWKVVPQAGAPTPVGTEGAPLRRSWREAPPYPQEGTGWRFCSSRKGGAGAPADAPPHSAVPSAAPGVLPAAHLAASAQAPAGCTLCFLLPFFFFFSSNDFIPPPLQCVTIEGSSPRVRGWF